MRPVCDVDYGKHLALVIDLQPGGLELRFPWVLLLMLSCPLSPRSPCPASRSPGTAVLYFGHVLRPFGDLSFSSYDIKHIYSGQNIKVSCETCK